MLAHERASAVGTVVLAHHVHRAGVVARRRERDVGGHVHMRGAHRLARNRLADARLAGTVAQVAGILVGERLEALQHEAGGLVADGAIRRVADHLGSARRFSSAPSSASQSTTRFEHRRQLRDAVATRNVLAAGLRRSPAASSAARPAGTCPAASPPRAARRRPGARRCAHRRATGALSIAWPLALHPLSARNRRASQVFPVRHSNANDAPCGGRARKARRRHTGSERRRRVMRTERSAAVPQKGQA